MIDALSHVGLGGCWICLVLGREYGVHRYLHILRPASVRLGRGTALFLVTLERGWFTHSSDDSPPYLLTSAHSPIRNLQFFFLMPKQIRALARILG